MRRPTITTERIGTANRAGTGQRAEPHGVAIDGRPLGRRRFAAVAVSAIAHASALVWLAGHIVSSPSRAPHDAAVVSAAPVRAPTAITVTPNAAMAVEIEVLPAARAIARPRPHSTAGASSSSTAAGPAAQTSRVASTAGAAPATAPTTAQPPGAEGALGAEGTPGAQGTPGAEGTPGDGRGAGPTGGSGAPSLTTMHYPKVGTGLSDRFVDSFLKHTKPLPPPPPEINSAANAGNAQIGELELKLANPRYHEVATPEEIENAKLDLESLKRERDNLRMVPIGGGRYRNREESFTIEIAPDGTVAIEDKPWFVFENMVSGRFDIADIIMRARRQDPYAWAKLHFLDKTRDGRAQIGRVHRTALLGRSAELMRGNIDRLWAMTADPRARRDGLFELWDDCAETGDADLLDGADQARRMVIGEIHARLHGADAYTADELRRFNARRTSIAPFAPYEELAAPVPARDPSEAAAATSLAVNRVHGPS